MKFPFSFVKTTGGFPPYDPSLLSLSGWWEDFAGAPWVPMASAGGSGSVGNFDEATNPPSTGTPLGGYGVASFNGTNSILTGPGFFSLQGAGAGFASILFYARTASADAGAAGGYLNPSFLADPGYTYIGFSDAGFRAGYYDGVDHNSVVATAPTLIWQCGQFRYNSTIMEARINNGSWVTLARGAPVAAGDPVVIGTNYGNTEWLDGDVASVITIDSALPDADADGILNYYRNKFGVPL